MGVFHPWRMEWSVGLFFQPVLVILCNIPFLSMCLFLHVHINCKCANSAPHGSSQDRPLWHSTSCWSLGAVQAINHCPLNLIVPTTFLSIILSTYPGYNIPPCIHCLEITCYILLQTPTFLVQPLNTGVVVEALLVAPDVLNFFCFSEG